MIFTSSVMMVKHPKTSTTHEQCDLSIHLVSELGFTPLFSILFMKIFENIYLIYDTLISKIYYIHENRSRTSLNTISDLF